MPLRSTQAPVYVAYSVRRDELSALLVEIGRDSWPNGRRFGRTYRHKRAARISKALRDAPVRIESPDHLLLHILKEDEPRFRDAVREVRVAPSRLVLRVT